MLTIDPTTYNSFARKSMLGSRQQPDGVPPQFTRILSDALTSLQNDFNAVTTFTTNVKSMITAQRKSASAAYRESRLESKIAPLASGGSAGIDSSRIADVVSILATKLDRVTDGLQKLDFSSNQEQPIIVNRGGRQSDRDIVVQSDSKRTRGRRAAIAGGALGIAGIAGAAMYAARKINTQDPSGGVVQPQQDMASEGFASWLGKTFSSIAVGIGSFFGGQSSASYTQEDAPTGNTAKHMMTLYNAFVKGGMTPEGAKTMVAQINRENNFQEQHLFGTHIDAANRATNIGMLSWQGDRGQRLLKYLSDRGLVRGGQMVKGDAALQAQAQFLVHEMSTSPQYSQSWKAVTTPGLSYQDIEATVGDNYVRWRRNDPKYREGGYRNQNRGYAQISALLDGNFSEGGRSNRTGGIGRVTGTFGENRGTHRHAGIDIAARQGTPVYSAMKGKIVNVVTYDDGTGYGLKVDVKHRDGLYTRYAHLSSISVRAGDTVDAGEKVGEVGNTGASRGNHLHFEVRTSLERESAIDPTAMYNANKWIVGGKQLTPPAQSRPQSQTSNIQATIAAKPGQSVRTTMKGGKGPSPAPAPRSGSQAINAVLNPGK